MASYQEKEINSKFGQNYICNVRKEHKQHAKWLQDCKEDFEKENAIEKEEITEEIVKKCRKMPNWKAL